MNLRLQYLDADVAYLLGCMVARGELITENGAYKAIITFPMESLIAEGENLRYDMKKEVRLGIAKVRERFLELLSADIRTVDTDESISLVITSTRNTIAWRNINMLLGGKTSFSSFDIPQVFLDEETPIEFKREFIKGFADVAGNIRPANRDQAGRHRVRLDILNYPTNWHVATKLCLLLQNHLNVPVPILTWGHPDLGSQWREHQLNVYAEEFLAIGFYFDFKQGVLEELAKFNRKHFPNKVKGCPGARRLGKRKRRDPEEKNAEKLPAELLGRHFNSYWQICRALGCTRRPAPREQLELLTED